MPVKKTLFGRAKRRMRGIGISIRRKAGPKKREHLKEYGLGYGLIGAGSTMYVAGKYMQNRNKRRKKRR